MTTANRNADNDPANRASSEDHTIVVTLSVVDVQLCRRTDPGSTTASWEDFFASEGPAPAAERSFAYGESNGSEARTAGAAGQVSHASPEPGPATDGESNVASALTQAEPPQRGKIYTVEMADRIARELRALPAIDRRGAGKRAIVGRLKEQIAIVQRRGYTVEEIAEHLTAAGFEISARTLKTYLQRAKRKSGKRAAKRLTGPLVLRDNVS